MTVLQRLRAPRLDERLAAVAEMVGRAHVDAEELHALGECLGGEPKVLQRRAAEAFATLHQRGIAVTDTLLGILQAAGRQQRWGAAYALSRLGAAPLAALPVLLEGLGANDGDLRWAAADALVHMEPAPESAAALRHLLADGTPSQRKMAAYCLRDLPVRSPAIEQALFAALDDPEPRVRLAAMSSLARVCHERAGLAARVAAMLGDTDAGVRRAAAAVLGGLGTPTDTVLAALHRAASSADLSVQRAALRSLRLLGA